jgi:hypothetical protein
MDEGRTDQLVFFAFDLLFLNGQSTAQLPLVERKENLARLFQKEIGGLRYSEHVEGDGPRFREHACKLGLEGAISKLADRAYVPRDLTAIFKLNGVAEPKSALDRLDAGATMSSSDPVRTVGRIGQHCIRIARTFRQVAWQRYAVSAV